VISASISLIGRNARVAAIDCRHIEAAGYSATGSQHLLHTGSYKEVLPSDTIRMNILLRNDYITEGEWGGAI